VSVIVELSYWAIVATSLANTVLLLWLGLTVLLNAERRTSGIGLVAGSLLIGDLFFISHTAIVGHGLNSLDDGMDFWWHLGLLAAIMLPYAWYVAILWYVGFWEDSQSPLHRRQRFWFGLNTLATAILGGLFLHANPFPSYTQVIVLRLSVTPTLGGIPLLILAYPVCTVMSIGLSLDALWRPGPSRRMMGDAARRRARPWLAATAAVLLAVGLLVAFVMLWVAERATRTGADAIDRTLENAVSYLDLIISGAILSAVLLLGQAVVHYEVFTGKTLPQRRFMRHWRNVVVLAMGYGLVMSASLQLQIHPIYSVLLTAVLVTLFYALFSQNSYTERERYIQDLRPFIVSQHLYDRLVAGAIPAELDVSVPFEALCRHVLGTQAAYLIPVGPLAPLVGSGLAYPPGNVIPALSLTDLSARLTSPQTMCVPVQAEHYGGATWAIPLWSERGLIGMLLLDEKSNGSLYTQEEIEIARASGERLIDTQASAEMARRLMALQRQRLVENQVIDRRSRRALHDDVLPQLHTAMLSLSAAQPDPSNAVSSVVDMLADIHRQIADLLHAMPANVVPVLGRSGLIAALRKALDEELGSAFDRVDWQIQPEVENEIRAIPLLTTEVLYYAVREAIRNAGHYGRGTQDRRPLHLKIQIRWCNGLEILIEDDGVGLDQADRSSAGSGHGLALHSTMLAIVGGSLAVESAAGQFTRVWLILPRQAY
jgi:signal transduction histidine kinase